MRNEYYNTSTKDLRVEARNLLGMCKKGYPTRHAFNCIVKELKARHKGEMEYRAMKGGSR